MRGFRLESPLWGEGQLQRKARDAIAPHPRPLCPNGRGERDIRSANFKLMTQQPLRLVVAASALRRRFRRIAILRSHRLAEQCHEVLVVQRFFFQ